MWLARDFRDDEAWWTRECEKQPMRANVYKYWPIRVRLISNLTSWWCNKDCHSYKTRSPKYFVQYHQNLVARNATSGAQARLLPRCLERSDINNVYFDLFGVAVMFMAQFPEKSFVLTTWAWRSSHQKRPRNHFSVLCGGVYLRLPSSSTH